MGLNANFNKLFENALPVANEQAIPYNASASSTIVTGPGRVRTIGILVAAASQTITLRDGTSDSDPIIFGPYDCGAVREPVTGLSIPFSVGLRLTVSGGTPGVFIEAK